MPVLYLGHFADSLTGYLVGGFFLGLGGTTFAIGIPFVNSWYPPARRGLALGIFGAGMGGTAISAFSTVQLTKAFGHSVPFDLVAAVLAIYAVIAYFVLRDRPDRQIAPGSMLSRLERHAAHAGDEPAVGSLRRGVRWFRRLQRLPAHLPRRRHSASTRSDAALRTAGFVVLAVVMRPVGGWLSDRTDPVKVLISAYSAVGVLAIAAAFEPPLLPVGTLLFLGMAAALGIGTGAVFALVAQLVEPGKVGAVTGVVGAAGGLGGFFPPLVMGAVYGATGSYLIGFLLLAATAATAALFTATVIRHRAEHPVVV